MWSSDGTQLDYPLTYCCNYFRLKIPRVSLHCFLFISTGSRWSPVSSLKDIVLMEGILGLNDF